MSIFLMSKVWKNSDVSGNKLLCLLALADWANDAGETWPSYETLAKKMRVSRRSAMRIVSDLEESGHIRKLKNGGQHGQNVYIIASDKMSPDAVASDASVTSASDTSVTPLVTPVSPNTLETHQITRQVLNKQKRNTSISDDWVPSERNTQDAIDRQFSAEEINHEANQFRDYHLAKGSTYKNWDAAWRTWLGNARKFASGPTNQGGRKNRGDIITDAVHQAGLRGFD